jgi:hypothetical protein
MRAHPVAHPFVVFSIAHLRPPFLGYNVNIALFLKNSESSNLLNILFPFKCDSYDEEKDPSSMGRIERRNLVTGAGWRDGTLFQN